MPDLLCKILSKIFYKQVSIHAKRNRELVDNDYVMKNFMRRVLMFDLVYLLELKQDSFKSDFDELRFTVSLILDLTRCISEKEGMKAASDDNRI